MIQNLLHTPSRSTETNASGIIKDGAGKDSGKEKEGLFKKLFESMHKNDQKGEVSNKPEGEINKEEAKCTESEKSSEKKESVSSGSEKNKGSQNITAKSEDAEKSNVTSKNDQTVSTQNTNDDTVKQNKADPNIAIQNASLSVKEKTILKTDGIIQTEQQDNRAGSEGKPVNAEVQNSEGGESENKGATSSRTPAQQGENVPNEPIPESVVQDNSRTADNSSNHSNSTTQNDQGIGKSETANMASSLKAQSMGKTLSTQAASTESGKSESGNSISTLQPQSQEGTSSTATESAEETRPSEGAKIAFEAVSASSQERSGQMKAQSGSEKQAVNASQVRPNTVPVSVTQGVEGAKPDLNTISEPNQAVNIPSELGTASKSAKTVPGESMLTEKESGNRTDTPLRDTGNIIARMVMGQMHGGRVADGPNAQTPNAAEFTRNAQAFVNAKGQMAEANRAPEPALTREELQPESLNKPEVFSISSDLKKVFTQKNKSQDERGRLDVDKLSMRAGESNRAPVLDMENMQFGSSGQQAMKWDWSAGSQSSSEKAEESVTFKTLTPEFTASKEGDAADQKNVNYTSLASVTISNISVKRNVLPGLSQVVLSSAAGKSSPESWNKHSFVLDDGSKIQLSSRKLDGVIQLKIGSTTPELNRLLQQHQNDIIQHLKKESELEIDLQFDNSQEESGFESFDDQNPASKSLQMHQTNGNRESTAGPKEYVSGRKIRTFGYNNMEWTA